MKTAIKFLQSLRSNVVASKSWSMITHKKELLKDVPHEDLEEMITELSNTLTYVNYELLALTDYLKLKDKYGSE